MLLALFRPKHLPIVEQFRFISAAKKLVSQYMIDLANLRCLAITSEFGDFLDQVLCNRFVCGL